MLKSSTPKSGRGCNPLLACHDHHVARLPSYRVHIQSNPLLGTIFGRRRNTSVRGSKVGGPLGPDGGTSGRFWRTWLRVESCEEPSVVSGPVHARCLEGRLDRYQHERYPSNGASRRVQRRFTSAPAGRFSGRPDGPACKILQTDFGEPPQPEVRRTSLPRTPVNKRQRCGAGVMRVAANSIFSATNKQG